MFDVHQIEWLREKETEKGEREIENIRFSYIIGDRYVNT